MAGTFSGLPLSQQFDLNGNPLAGCLLYVYAGGTTTPATVYKDLGLTILAPWPLQADATGRLPIFFVADGNYHLRLTDASGVLQLDVPGLPSIGASSTGSSGGAVDPNTVATTGDVKWQAIKANPGDVPGWVRLNGKTIGSASSGATEYANAQAQTLFSYLWNNFPNGVCPVLGGRGASSLADWTANRQITLLDFRGRGTFGLDDMGSTAANRLASALFTAGDAVTAASTGGEAAHTLSVSELPSHSHAVSGLTGLTDAQGTHSHGGGTGAAGGHSHSASADVQGAHSHGGGTTFNGTHNHGGTDAQGTHAHGGGTGATGGHAHVGTTDPGGVDHTHSYTQTNVGGLAGAGGSGLPSVPFNVSTPTTQTGGASAYLHTHTFTTSPVGDHAHAIGADGNHAHNIGNDGNHQHGISVDGAHGHNISVVGVGDHAHAIAADGNHAHNVSINPSTTSAQGSGQIHNNMPPFILGTWFMKL